MLRHLLPLMLLAGALAGELPILRTTAQEDARPRYLPLAPGQSMAGGYCAEVLLALNQIDPGLRFSGLEQTMPVNRMLALLQSGQLDIFACLSKTPEREATIRFLDPPILELHNRLAVRADDPIQIRHLDELRALGKDGVILVNRGSGSAMWLQSQPGLHIDGSGYDQPDNLKKLLAGMGRFYFRHDFGLQAEIAALKLQQRVRILPIVLNTQQQYLAIQRGLPLETQRRVEAALQQLHQSGELARLRARYP
ncbi:substrate-binding periplasmic protein [Chitinimonas taiwanensis]|uniref:substrate-binding periplasmic protein n=1 Tax=Chitinimonas taiwanensis TaxID=240412 RepID=UPI0035AEC0DB